MAEEALDMLAEIGLPGGSMYYEGYTPLNPDVTEDVAETQNNDAAFRHLMNLAATDPARMLDNTEFRRFRPFPVYGQDAPFPTTPSPNAPVAPLLQRQQMAAPPRLPVPRQIAPVPQQSLNVAGGKSRSEKRIANEAGYGDQLKGRPVVNVRPPLNIDISIVEITTFFPSWFRIPFPILRAVQNGFKAEQLATMQLVSVGRSGGHELKQCSDRIKKQMSKAGDLHWQLTERWDAVKLKRDYGLQHDLTANSWKLRSEYDGTGKGKSGEREWVDMKLVDIAGSVPTANWPQGEDRLLLTACLEFAVAHPTLDLTTAHWDWIIQRHLQNFNIPPRPVGPNVNRDTAALARLFPG